MADHDGRAEAGGARRPASAPLNGAGRFGERGGSGRRRRVQGAARLAAAREEAAPDFSLDTVVEAEKGAREFLARMIDPDHDATAVEAERLLRSRNLGRQQEAERKSVG